MYLRADPGEDSAELAPLREALLAVILSHWGATPAAGTTSHACQVLICATRFGGSARRYIASQ